MVFRHLKKRHLLFHRRKPTVDFVYYLSTYVISSRRNQPWVSDDAFVYGNNNALLEISSAHNFGACTNVSCYSMFLNWDLSFAFNIDRHVLYLSLVPVFLLTMLSTC